MSISDDIQLSKMSYTNKDFGTIYPDLLDLAKKLTTKWDPSLSNESDPGVVLLKEGAFIADHSNYNIDKNVLESFLPSATQQNSVRDILSMNGYTPGYYVSATGDITFSYQLENEDEFSSLSIPAFSIIISTEDGSITYTQADPLVISSLQTGYKCKFIQGTLQQLEVNGSNIITIEDLDDNDRLYLPSSMIAENGIYITDNDESKTPWEKEIYLLTRPIGTKAYSVGYDSHALKPFILFPSDIANLIGSGLSINYIQTIGANGNVAAYALNTIKSIKGDTEDKIKNGLTLSNKFAITNGKDPETIDEMYKSFQKVVGTFDTLVTRRDYQNAIYKLTDNYNNKLVSNDYVTDINNDYNHAINIIAYDKYGEYFENASYCTGITHYIFVTDPISISNPLPGYIKFDNGEFKVYNKDGEWELIYVIDYASFVKETEAMSPYDLYTYMFRSYNSSEYTSKKRFYAIDKSFEYLSKDVQADYQKVTDALDMIEDLKCINHNYKLSDKNDIVCFQNQVPIRATIIPYQKVSRAERDEIIDNVYRALSDNFNAQQVEFGEELDYDTVVKVILNADDRIKSARVEDFDYSLVAQYGDNTLQPIVMQDDTTGKTYNKDIMVDLIAKNVLAGRVCLLQLDDEFTNSFGLVSAQKHSKIETITTQSKITLNPATQTGTSQQTSTNTYVLGDNRLDLKVDNTPVTIPSGKTVAIANNDKLTVKYSESSTGSYSDIHLDSNPVKQTVKIKNGGLFDITITKEFTSIDCTDVEVKVEVDKTASEFTGKVDPVENEYVHVAYDNYSAVKTYIVPTKVRFESTVSTDKIPANTDYKLKTGLKLIFNYTSSGSEVSTEYPEGTFIRSTFDIVVTDVNSSASVTRWKDSNGAIHEGEKFDIIANGQQVSKVELMETILTSVATPCYWIKSNSDNCLFEKDTDTTVKTFTILGSGEYFIYSNQERTTMVILGSGTKIERASGSPNLPSDWICEKPQVSLDLGSMNDTNISYKSMDFSQYNLKLQEMNILTFGDGDLVTFNFKQATPTSVEINNIWLKCQCEVTYILSGESTSTTIDLSGDSGCYIRSRLDLAMTKEKGLTLAENTGTRQQSISLLLLGSTEPVEITSGSVMSSLDLYSYGDTLLDVSSLISNDSSLDMMAYNKLDCTNQIPGAEKPTILESYNNKYTLTTDSVIDATFPFSISNNNEYIIPIFVWCQLGTPSPIKIFINKYDSEGKPTEGRLDFKIFGEPDSLKVTEMNLELSKMFLLQLVPGDYVGNLNLRIQASKDDENPTAIVLNPLVIYNGLNSNLATTKAKTTSGELSSIQLSDVVSRILELVLHSTKPETEPYYIYKPEQSIAMQNDNLYDPINMWDNNNVANHMTIAKIDLTSGAGYGSEDRIDIIKSMRNYT